MSEGLKTKSNAGLSFWTFLPSLLPPRHKEGFETSLLGRSKERGIHSKGGIHRLPSTKLDKSLRTLLQFWGIFLFTQKQALPYSQNKSWTCVSRIFFRVSTLHNLGGGRTARKFQNRCTFLWGIREMTKIWILHCCPRTFVQDCNSQTLLTMPQLFKRWITLSTW